MAIHYWMVKTEPGAFSFDDLERDGWTCWDGVRNHQAKKNLATMALNDWVLVYHSITDKAVVGLAKVSKTAYPDPSDSAWTSVDIVPVARFQQPVTLAEIKAASDLQNLPLIKQSRLSVMPLAQKDFEKLLAMGGIAS